MNIVVNKKEILSALQKCNAIMKKDHTLPILDFIRFDVDKSECVLKSTNLELSVISKFICQSEEKTSFLIEPNKLEKILKSLSDEVFTLIIDKNLSINTISGEYSFPILFNVDEFPAIVEVVADVASIKGDILKRIITKCGSARGCDELRPVMSGVFLACKDNNLTACGTDAFILININIPFESDDFGFIIPGNACDYIGKFLSDDDVKIKFSNKNISFESGNDIFISRLTEGNYPNFKAVIPKDNPINVQVSKNAILNALKRVSILSNENTNLVIFSFSSNLLTIVSQDIDKSLSGKEKIQCDFNYEDFKIGVKGEKIKTIIDNCESEILNFEFSDSSRAGVIKHNSDIYLIMPMMLQ